MEHHGEIPKQNIVAVIPARYASKRLPGKLLLDVGGEPLILHTLRRASEARMVTRVITATDDVRIFDVVSSHGFEAVMTSAAHQSGSDRVAEVAEGLPSRAVIVNVQGDEPTISPDTIDKAVDAILADSDADIITTSEPIETVNDVLNPNIVKVVTAASGYALYFSRSPVPFPRTAVMSSGDWKSAFVAEPLLLKQYRKHTGLYVYRREFLLEFAKMVPSPLEQIEMLEQLRALENGAKIRVVDACRPSIGVDTVEDLERVRQIAGQTVGFSRGE